MTPALKKARQALNAALQFVINAVVWIVLLFIGGIGSIVYGVYLLAGKGPSAIVLGVFLLCACVILKKAVVNG
ncbi:hypothetical protein ACPW6H_005605 [Pseudomonas aeruginosa]